MKKSMIFTVALIGATGFTQTALAAVSSDDFVKNFSVANEFEIESSKLALDKSQNKDIKLFAQHMVDGHTQMGDDLQTLLQSAKPGMKLESNLDDDHQKLMKKLESESGDTFNHDYVAIQLKSHKEAVNLFTDYSKNGKDEALKSFANNTLPAIESHLHDVEKIRSKE